MRQRDLCRADADTDVHTDGDAATHRDTDQDPDPHRDLQTVHHRR
jgi:hypothetical protein